MGKLREVEKKNPKLAEKTAQMRGQAMKHLSQIKQKGSDDLKKLKAINQEKLQKTTLNALNKTVSSVGTFKSTIGLN